MNRNRLTVHHETFKNLIHNFQSKVDEEGVYLLHDADNGGDQVPFS